MPRMSTTERKVFYYSRLKDHRENLESAITAMSEGRLSAALTIATTIRVLLHETGRSKPLLKSLREDYLALQIREGPAATGAVFTPLNQKIAVMHLPFAVFVHFSEPRISLNPNPDMNEYGLCSLGSWWTRPVLMVPGCEVLSRKEVVLGVADKEGAHVDDEMSIPYRQVLESTPLRFTIGEVELEPINVTRFTVGQAGIEMLDLLNRTFPLQNHGS